MVPSLKLKYCSHLIFIHHRAEKILNYTLKTMFLINRRIYITQMILQLFLINILTCHF